MRLRAQGVKGVARCLRRKECVRGVVVMWVRRVVKVERERVAV